MFYHPYLSNRIPGTLPRSGATQGYLSYGTLLQAYQFLQASCGGPHMVPHPQFTSQGLSSIGAPQVPQALLGINPIIWLRASPANPPGHHSTAPIRYCIMLPMNRFQPAADLGHTDDIEISNLPYCWRFPTGNMTQMIIVLIYCTWVVSKANPQSVGRNSNFAWKNLLNGWGSSTLLSSISGRKYGWLGFCRKSIGVFFVEKTVWNSVKKDPSTVGWLLQFFWQISKTGRLWTFVTTPNWFGYSELPVIFEMC